MAHHRLSRRVRAAAALLVAMLAATTAAGPLEIGTSLPALALADQRDAPGAVDASTRAVLFTHDMDGGSVVKEALAANDQAWLDARGLVYVADISGMPALVSRLMAVPSMRKRAYRMLLDRDGAATRDLPRADGQATLLVLRDGRIAAIEHFGAGPALRARLDALPAP